MKYINNKSRLLIALLSPLLLLSCISDEPLNSECDIIGVELVGNKLNRAPIISNDKVVLIVKNDVSLIQPLSPVFTLTPGATIEPANGTPLVFLFPQTYKVTSEDGKWSKTYTVEVQKNNSVNLDYSFENVRLVNALGGLCSYDEFYETDASGKEPFAWASANSAFAMTLQASAPETFPTYQGSDGVSGKCVVLTTRSTGNFGGRVGKPIAAGNLFMGQFVGENAVKEPLKATHFGIPFRRVPSSFSGVYKYTPGETYCEPDADGKLVPVPGKTDMFNLYLVMFETSEKVQWLDGTNVLAEDNPNIIGTAEIPDRHASDDWVEFSVPFRLRPGKSFDRDKLKAGLYSMAVVMSSSQDGDYFCGAIGSTLCVDELHITCVSDL